MDHMDCLIYIYMCKSVHAACLCDGDNNNDVVCI